MQDKINQLVALIKLSWEYFCLFLEKDSSNWFTKMHSSYSGWSYSKDHYLFHTSNLFNFCSCNLSSVDLTSNFIFSSISIWYLETVHNYGRLLIPRWFLLGNHICFNEYRALNGSAFIRLMPHHQREIRQHSKIHKIRFLQICNKI